MDCVSPTASQYQVPGPSRTTRRPETPPSNLITDLPFAKLSLTDKGEMDIPEKLERHKYPLASKGFEADPFFRTPPPMKAANLRSKYQDRSSVFRSQHAIVITRVPTFTCHDELLSQLSQMGLPLPNAFEYYHDKDEKFDGIALASFRSAEEAKRAIAFLNSVTLQGSELRAEHRTVQRLDPRDTLQAVQKGPLVISRGRSVNGNGEKPNENLHFPRNDNDTRQAGNHESINANSVQKRSAATSLLSELSPPKAENLAAGATLAVNDSLEKPASWTMPFMSTEHSTSSQAASSTRSLSPYQESRPLFGRPTQHGAGSKSDNAFGRLASLSSSEASSDGSVLKASSDTHSVDTDIEFMYEDDATLADNGEERILNPQNYYDGLDALEKTIASNSALHLYTSSTPAPGNGRFRCSEKGCDLNICALSPGTKSSYPYLPRHSSNHESYPGVRDILECRNLLARAIVNATLMQEARYSNGTFNLLVLDQSRASVARLIPFHLSALKALFEAFELVCRDYQVPHKQLDRTLSQRSRREWSFKSLTCKCQKLLADIGLPQSGRINPIKAWRWTSHILDFALLSYAGTHLEAFDEKFLLEKRQFFSIPGSSESLESPAGLDEVQDDSTITLRRRRLQCLDEFLGHQAVWVFHLDDGKARAPDDSHLLLSTGPQCLADIWGPMWASSRLPKVGKIHEYNIGNGVIVPWSCDKSSPGSSASQPREDEKFCHWISSRNYNIEDIKAHQCELTSPFFDGTETLLIGAQDDSNPHIESTSVSTCAATVATGLQINPACKMSVDDLVRIKNSLRKKMALRQPRTKNPRRYKDSHAVQIQGSAMGFVSVSDTVTYKRRRGQSMKDALVERWRYGKWNPAELESYSGVAISLCTTSARRQRLLDILRSRTMRKYLSSISFEWADNKCKHKYFESLGDPKSFYRSWNLYGSYRQYWGRAISLCLDALQETGVSEENQGLSALWVENFDEEPKAQCRLPDDTDVDSGLANGLSQLVFEKNEEWIVTLARSEHNWTGFFSDSTTSLTVAVMDNACLTLDSTLQYARGCQTVPGSQKRISTAKSLTPEYPILQTALQINEDILKNEGLKHENKSWNIKGVKKGARLNLGEQGFLTVCTQPRTLRTPFLFVEWYPVKSKKWQELMNLSINEHLLGKSPEKHHQEYINGKWDVEPLPVLIISKTKVALRIFKD